jgi:tetratricopeptide (TPR) repeat protein
VAPRRLALVTAVVAALAGVVALRGWSPPVLTIAPRWLPAARASSDAGAITEEAIRLYATGHFASACERFRAASERDPGSAARREDAWRCFEGWGWQALSEGRAEEAIALFRQGLQDAPESPALLRGLGVAAVHAGRPDDAIPPLEAVAGASHDVEVRMLLAHLYDRRDDIPRAVLHLNAVLGVDAHHEAALRLRRKLERERLFESDFEREASAAFVIKWPAAASEDRRRLVRRVLETARGRLERELRYHPGEPVMVVLYPDDDFRAVTGAHEWASGAFDGKVRLPLGATERNLERLVMHEVTHAAVHAVARGRAPRWLHEGIAQMMEGADVDPMLRVPATVTLAGVEALVTDPDPVRARAGYDLSLWIVRDLLDRGGTPRLAELLARLGGGEGLETAFTRVYGFPLTELESQWRRVLGG